MKFWKLTPLLLSAAMLCANTKEHGAVVDFSACISQSKYGKKEQESFDKLRKQMTTVMQDTEKQLKEISSKLEDTDYLDTLSPKAEEELKIKYQSLVEDMNRYQNEFYQTLSQANYIMHQKMHMNISRAAEKIAKESRLPFVINKDSCFYFNPNMEITNQILDEMDKSYELEKISNLSDPGLDTEKAEESLR